MSCCHDNQWVYVIPDTEAEFQCTHSQDRPLGGEGGGGRGGGGGGGGGETLLL